MPLKPCKKNIGANIRELKADNMKSGKAKGANGTVRPAKQILAIALNKSGVNKKAEPKHSAKHEKMESKAMKLKEKKKYKKS